MSGRRVSLLGELTRLPDIYLSDWYQESCISELKVITQNVGFSSIVPDLAIYMSGQTV